ncbi:interferon beta-like [Ambystoma mexicanum]|uniref:interferon beta-like n=1 Tax=Ambystoma mexicanum TaxID=8296 RepID=UPI0037E7B702
MRGTFPKQCLDETLNIKFPHGILKRMQKHPHTRQRLLLEIFNILHSINKINRDLSKNLAKTAQDTRNTELFMQGLQRQADILAECLPGDSGMKIRGRKKLDRYFQKMRVYLKQKKNDSSCAWQNVNLQLETCLRYVDRLTSMIPSSEC